MFTNLLPKRNSTYKFNSQRLMTNPKRVLGLILVSLGLLGILIFGLMAAINLTLQIQDLAKKAAPATTITATTANPVVSEGQIFSVEINVNTDVNIVKAADFGLVYDPTYLQLIEISKGNWLSQANEAIKIIDQAAGKTLFGLVLPRSASPAYITGQGTAVVATFKALRNNPEVKIDFDRALTVVGAANEQQNAIALYIPLSLGITTVVTPPSENGFIIYSYVACFSQNSDGHSTYCLWKVADYADVKTIEVSEHSDFSQLSSKNVAGATNTLPYGYLLSDGTNFRLGNNSDGAVLSFRPDVTYYFRLNYGLNLKSPIVIYKPPSCAGTGGTSIKQCNEACTNSNECLTNLTCKDNKCRRIGNETNDKCVLPPDGGIHRGCNEYCSNDGECGSGYKCWWNQCRNPRDTTNASCKVDLKPGEVEGCNIYCANDGECATGLKCWWNQCRLAQNTSSNICQLKPTAAPAQNKGDEVIYTKPTKKSATPTTAPRATVSAKVKIITDEIPAASPTFIKLLKTAVLPTQPPVQPTLAKTGSNNAATNFLNAIPMLLVIIFLALMGLLFGPQVLAMIRAKTPPTAPPVV